MKVLENSISSKGKIHKEQALKNWKDILKKALHLAIIQFKGQGLIEA